MVNLTRSFYIVESLEYAVKDRPEIAIETDNINEIYNEVSSKRADVLHPNLTQVTKRPGALLSFPCWLRLEFVLYSPSGHRLT